jgi:HEPN domain-containing protein
VSERSDDWFSQAEHDLDAARDLVASQNHGWACFVAQQAAEMALKAVHLAEGREAWGHVVVDLMESLPEPPDPMLIERARVLDNFYVPTRYANGHAAGPPHRHYGPLQSEAAVGHAHAIVEFARARLAEAR